MRTLKRITAAVVALVITLPAVSQDDVIDFLGAGLNDAHVLSHAYLKPYGEMLGTSLNAGWYNTARVHKFGGFDLTVSVMAAMAPSSRTIFDVSKLRLETFSLAPGSPHMTPNVAGEIEESNLPRLQPNQSGNDYEPFTLPNGTGFNKMPVPMIQAGIGLPLHSELIVRFVPKLDIGDVGEVGLLGFGLKHSLKDYIPFVKRTPFLELSALMAYTRFNSLISVEDDVPGNELDVSSSGFTGRLLVGANFPVIALYTGLGYGSTNSDFDLKGMYEVSGSGPALKDPLSLNYKTNGFDFNAGLRLRLGFLAIHGDYTFGTYPTLTAGVGINIR